MSFLLALGQDVAIPMMPMRIQGSSGRTDALRYHCAMMPGLSGG